MASNTLHDIKFYKIGGQNDMWNVICTFQDPREKFIVSLKREIKILRQENHYLRQQVSPSSYARYILIGSYTINQSSINYK